MRKKRFIRDRLGKVSILVGKSIMFVDMPRVLGKALVGLLFRKLVCVDTIKQRMEHNWLLVLEYLQSFHVLVHGGICFMFS